MNLFSIFFSILGMAFGAQSFAAVKVGDASSSYSCPSGYKMAPSNASKPGEIVCVPTAPNITKNIVCPAKYSPLVVTVDLDSTRAQFTCLGSATEPAKVSGTPRCVGSEVPGMNKVGYYYQITDTEDRCYEATFPSTAPYNTGTSNCPAGYSKGSTWVGLDQGNPCGNCSGTLPANTVIVGKTYCTKRGVNFWAKPICDTGAVIAGLDKDSCLIPAANRLDYVQPTLR